MSENNIMDETLDNLKIDDIDTLSAESERLLIENTELRKLMGLMQENVELRGTLKNHEMKIRSLSPPRKPKNNAKDKDKNLLKTRPNQNIEKNQLETRPNSYKDKNVLETCPNPNKDKNGLKTRPNPFTTDEAPTPPSRPPPDPEKVKKCEQIVGEIAFQLDRRILCIVFQEQQRLYGYHVANIKEKIIQVTTCPLSGKVHEQLRSDLKERYHNTMDQLRKLGYDTKVHPYFTQHLVNTYGILKEKTVTGSEEMLSMNDPQSLRKMITKCMPSDRMEDILIILQCLAYLAQQNGKPMFNW